jgi:ubiquinone/menaquinone biosynthesis C-methylase UbiE
MTQESLNPATVKEIVRQHWGQRAATFDDVPNHGLHSDEQSQAWLARLRGWSSGGTLDVLDVGCGTGFLALLLARLGHCVTGVDIAAEMLDRARVKATSLGLKVDLQLDDADYLLFADDSFDLVVERHVIWTMPEPARALEEWRRVLRPGAHLVLVEGDWRSNGHPDYATIRDALPLYGGRPSAELQRVVEKAGFVNVTIEPLTDAVLWGSAPERERYALHAWKPSAV